MKYVILDTNIIIDMIIDRRHNVSSKLVESFIKLLDFNEIKVIVPAIVVYETNKHIEEQLAEVGHKIKGAIKSLEAIYGINGYKIDGLDINEYKKNSKKELNELYTKYKDNQTAYLQELQSIVKSIFEHRNCVVIEDTDEMRSQCLKRRIYKRAPMHYEKKESFADAMIVETILQFSNVIDLKEDDEAIFVTGNTEDFSDNIQKKVLHEDILNDLKKVGLEEKVHYITTFGELIAIQLKEEVQNANLKEEFENEMKAQEEEDRQLLDAEIEDNERESVGLTPLGEYEDKLLDEYRESDFAENLVRLFEKLSTCYSDLEEIASFYSEEFQYKVQGLEAEEIVEFIKKWNEVKDDIEGEEVYEDVSGIIDILEWIKGKTLECDYSEIITRLPDVIEFGEDIEFYVLDKEKYRLCTDELYLSCENGSVDWLDINLYSKDELCKKGTIEITYGFVDYDDDGGIGDACGEDISIEASNILEFISEKIDEFETYVANEQGKMELLRETYDM